MLEYGAASSYLSHIHSLYCNGPFSSSGKLFCKKPYTVYAGDHEGSPATPYTPNTTFTENLFGVETEGVHGD